MRQIRTLGLALAVGLTLGSIAAVSPTSSASATTLDPIAQNEFVAGEIYAHEDGSFSAVDCDAYGDLIGVHFDVNNQLRGAIDASSYCMRSSNTVLEDGTILTNRNTPGWHSEIVAWKNGRELWTTDISSPTNCAYYAGTDYQMAISAIGQDVTGNLYATVASNSTPQACDDRLVGFDGDTGAIILDTPIGRGTDGGTSYVSSARLWVYDEDIIVVDKSGMVRYYAIDTGLEDTSKRYTFPLSDGHYIEHLTANEDGTVFAMTYAPLVMSPNPRLYYHPRTGTSDYITDTNVAYGVDGTNECHRSEDAYPLLLEEDSDLELNLTAFVACSGATTANITSTGQWGEPKQLDALSDSTDVVTLTIGGNDVGFGDVLQSCVAAPSHPGWGCSSNTTLLSDISAKMSALNGTSTFGGIVAIYDVIEAIDIVTDGATVYVGGYPKLFGENPSNFTSETGAPGGAVCAVGAELMTVSITDALWMNDVSDDLNDILHDAVDEAILNGIDAYFVPASFEEHGMCGEETLFINPITVDSYSPLLINPGGMHPNYQGIVEGYGFPFSIFIS